MAPAIKTGPRLKEWTIIRSSFMRMNASTFLARFLGLILLTLPAPAEELVFHVAPDGNDSWSGTFAQANADSTDGPFATLQRARDAIRTLRKTGTLDKGATVELQAGTYFLSKALELTTEDSGTEGAPIVYRSAPGAKVTLTGGRPVAGWAPVKDPAILKRLPESARGKVQVADLEAQGITDFGKLSVRGFAIGSGAAEAELIYGNQPMTLARWPNDGFAKVKGRKDEQTIEVDTDRLARWKGEAEPWVFAYWHHDWAEIYEPIVGMDAAKQTLLRSPKIKPRYGVTPSRARWYGFNLLSEIDAPGEYYIDRAKGRIYFWPQKAGQAAVLTVTDGLVRGRDVSHVELRGFTLEACRAAAVRFLNGGSCSVVACTIRHSGRAAVDFTGGTRHTVIGCDVYHTGSGGIFMTGGDRKTLTPAGHNAENNHVHHYARRARTYRPAIAVSGVGNRIAHNLIHDGPHMALSAGGNDHIVEFNEIHNVVEESGDAGAYYVGRDWTQRGNQLRYNYWHQIVGATGHGGMTIYLDDQHSGHAIYGNLFERCSRAVFIGGGDDNQVTDNVFIDCWEAGHLDDRGMGWQNKATMDPDGELQTRLRAMPYQNELWSKRYPQLVNVMDDQFQVPKRNLFTRNISAGGIWDDINPKIREFQTVKDNLVFDDDGSWITLVKDSSGKPVEIRFKDPEAVKRIGFKPIPVEKIGLYPDQRRASWPAEHTVRPVKLAHD